MPMTALPATSRRAMFAQPFAPSTVICIVFTAFSFVVRVRPHHVDQGMLSAGDQGERMDMHQ
jgi:hypothetical protein